MNPILQKFCGGANEPRDYLKKPMRSKHGACACNGHIMVCLPQDDGDYAATPDSLKKAFDKFAALEILDSIAVEDLIFPIKINCLVCGGNGHRHVVECDECDGEGEFTHGTHTYECKECDGDGAIGASENNLQSKQIPCNNCEGRGEQWTDMPVGNTNFSTVYMRMIAELPNAHIKPDGMSMAKFTFDGGWGVLMPVSKGRQA